MESRAVVRFLQGTRRGKIFSVRPADREWVRRFAKGIIPTYKK